MRILLLPGLGADGRLFQELRCPDGEIRTPPWIQPSSSRETLAEYAARFSKSLSELTSGEPVCVGGLSFGGLVAFEIARTLPHVRALLIATPILHAQMTAQFRALNTLLGVIPNFAVRAGLRSLGLGRMRRMEKTLSVTQTDTLRSMADGADLEFFRWAANACATWTGGLASIGDMNAELKSRVRILQGRHDYVIPRVADGDRSVVRELEDGAHLLNFTHAKEVSRWISESLSTRAS